MDVRKGKMDIIMHRLTYLKTEVSLAGSLNLTDVNIHAENFYRDLFNKLGYTFTNTNFDKQNAAHIDLIDKTNKRAIQVTSQNDNTKILESITGFYSQSEYTDYKLELLLISKDAKEYTTDFTLGGTISFDHKKDVIDIKRLIANINNLETQEIQDIASFLETEILFPRAETECSEVETIMSLIDFLSNENNRQPIQQAQEEYTVDPDKKINKRFSEHASFLLGRYASLCAVYSRPLEIARQKMDTIQAIIISDYLQFESDDALSTYNNDPKLALSKLVNYFDGKLSKNGFASYNKQAIHFYLLDEMIKCNVFPIF